MSLRVRVAWVAPVSTCDLGHVHAVGKPEKTVQIRCDRCDQWTWADGTFCMRCGIRLKSDADEHEAEMAPTAEKQLR